MISLDTVQSALAPADNASTFGDMPSRRKTATQTQTFTPMNALSRLIHRRKEELDLTWYDIADRGGFSSHTIVYALAKKAEHRQVPRAETLTRLARALDLPEDVVKVAAAEAAGFELTEVQTTLETAEDVRIIAGVMANLSDRDRARLRRIAIAMADEVASETQSAEIAKVRSEMSDDLGRVSSITPKRRR